MKEIKEYVVDIKDITTLNKRASIEKQILELCPIPKNKKAEILRIAYAESSNPLLYMTRKVLVALEDDYTNYQSEYY